MTMPPSPEERYGADYLQLKIDIEDRFADNPWITQHAARYAATIVQLRQLLLPGIRVLELEFSNVLHQYLDTDIAVWDYTTRRESEPPSATATMLTAPEAVIGASTHYAMDLQQDRFPVQKPTYDLVIACEVIQKMAVDPMFLMSEINRVQLTGARLFLTTPNGVSARIAHKAVNGYHPSFYQKYTRAASPWRHNFEYSVGLLQDLATAAGYRADSFDTMDLFEPSMKEAYELLGNIGAPLEHRGDDIFLLATKVGTPAERYPASLYD